MEVTFNSLFEMRIFFLTGHECNEFTFNSLFEMLYNLDYTDADRDVAGLSILYLRCSLEERGASSAETGLPFNSLFEMPRAQSRVRRMPKQLRLSILYLRCTV